VTDKDQKPTKHEFRNESSDPRHAASKETGAPTVTPSTALPPEEYLTEKEQDALAGGNGVGPVTPSAESPPLETMEDLDIGPADPYPVEPPPPINEIDPPPETSRGVKGSSRK
jgi:hypothetical protein